MLEQARSELIREIMLQINKNLYINGEISRELHECSSKRYRAGVTNSAKISEGNKTVSHLK